MRPGSEAATIHARDRKSNAADSHTNRPVTVLREAHMLSARLVLNHAPCRWPESRNWRAGGFWIACLTLWSCIATSHARAYEDQASLGLQLGYAYATQHSSPHHGGLVGIEGSLGLDDTFSVRGLISYGLQPGTRPLSELNIGAELIYMIDVLALVPYFGGGIDALGSWQARGAAFAADFAVHPVFGIDWLPSRNWVLGLEARPLFLLTALRSQPIYVTVAISAALLFDL
jgi:hypothetical protein